MCPNSGFSIKKCISLIHEAGGRSVLAHPKDIGLPDWRLEPLLKKMIGYGLWGLEAYHPSQAGFEKKYLDMAKRMGLFCTAGSDHHNKTPIQGYIAQPHDPLWDQCSNAYWNLGHFVVHKFGLWYNESDIPESTYVHKRLHPISIFSEAVYHEFGIPDDQNLRRQHRRGICKENVRVFKYGAGRFRNHRIFR